MSNHMYNGYVIMSNHMYNGYVIMSNHMYNGYVIMSNHMYNGYVIMSCDRRETMRNCKVLATDLFQLKSFNVHTIHSIVFIMQSRISTILLHRIY